MAGQRLIVCNTSPLINLAETGCLDLLTGLPGGLQPQRTRLMLFDDDVAGIVGLVRREFFLFLVRARRRRKNLNLDLLSTSISTRSFEYLTALSSRLRTAVSSAWGSPSASEDSR